LASYETTSEQTARDARYDFLRTTARRCGARYLVTAHTADDQAETILHRLIRGTGIAGLAGIPAFRQFLPGVSLARPMLAIRRSQVIDYLASLGQPFRTDHSNDDLRFTRNRIRAELLPQLASNYNPSVVAALTRLGELAGEAQEVIDQVARELAERCVSSPSSGSVVIDCVPLRACHRYLVRSLLISVWQRQNWPLQDMGFQRWEELAEMALAEKADVSKRRFPGDIAAAREGETLVLLAEQKSPY
jgi:tRNA(Ile)-lysidine synthase